MFSKLLRNLKDWWTEETDCVLSCPAEHKKRAMPAEDPPTIPPLSIVLIESHGKYLDRKFDVPTWVDAETSNNGEWILLRQTENGVYCCRILHSKDDRFLLPVKFLLTDASRDMWYTVVYDRQDIPDVRKTIRTLKEIEKGDAYCASLAKDALNQFEKKIPTGWYVEDLGPSEIIPGMRVRVVSQFGDRSYDKDVLIVQRVNLPVVYLRDEARKYPWVIQLNTIDWRIREC